MVVIISRPFFVIVLRIRYVPNMEHYFSYNLSSGKTIVNRCCQMKDKEIRKVLIAYLQTQGKEMRIYHEKNTASSICNIIDIVTSHFWYITCGINIIVRHDEMN